VKEEKGERKNLPPKFTSFELFATCNEEEKRRCRRGTTNEGKKKRGDSPNSLFSPAYRGRRRKGKKEKRKRPAGACRREKNVSRIGKGVAKKEKKKNRVLLHLRISRLTGGGRGGT